MSQLNASEIALLAREFAGRKVEEILEWAVSAFTPRLAMTSNFGVEGVVVMDHLRRIAPDVPIIYIETGYQFAETDRLKEELRARLGVNIIDARSGLSVAEQDQIYGERLYARDSNQCCRLRKVEPLAEALRGYDAWIAALRRDSSPTRAGWTRERVWDYIFEHRLPYNALYDQGYSSIGCVPCTRAVAAGEHERAGRWDGLTKMECGIHL
jgi:phosphoadenosine phosphosulfate reductase